MTRWCGVLSWAMSLLVQLPASAQPIRTRAVSGTPGRLQHEFSHGIFSVREIADGRVMVVAAQGSEVLLVDFDTQRAGTVGRMGHGPNEYPMVGRLFPLSGDSTLMAVGPKWVFMQGGEIVRTINAPRRSDDDVQQAVSLIYGTDDHGHLLGHRAVTPVRTERASDVLFSDVILFDRRTETVETIARLRSKEARTRVAYDAKGKVTSMQLVSASPLSANEHAALSADGWVAILRRDPYRLEWRRPDGTWIRSGSLPYDTERVDRAEREWIVDREAEASGLTRMDPGWYYRWPSQYPAYVDRPWNRALFIAPDGRALVRRPPTRRHPESRYDVIDREGRLVERIAFPPNHRLLAIARWAYVELTDDDGFRWLLRYPWP